MLSYFGKTLFSMHDGPGVRLVLFLQGCRLDCSWCHSPHSRPPEAPLLFFESLCLSCRRCEEACAYDVHRFSGSRHLVDRSNCIRCGACVERCPQSHPKKYTGALQLLTRRVEVDTLFQRIKPHLALLRHSGGVTFSGGEPLLQYRELSRLARACKSAGCHTAVETSGIASRESVSALKPYIDTWLVGLRLGTGTDTFDDSFLTNTTRQTLTILQAPPKSEVVIRIPAVPPLASDELYLARAQEILNDFSVSTVEILPHNPGSSLFYDALGIAPQCSYDAGVAEAHYRTMQRIFKRNEAFDQNRLRRVDHDTGIVTPNRDIAGEPR